MKIKDISVSYQEKITIGYNGVQHMVSASASLEEEDNPDFVYQHLLNFCTQKVKQTLELELEKDKQSKMAQLNKKYSPGNK